MVTFSFTHWISFSLVSKPNRSKGGVTEGSISSSLPPRWGEPRPPINRFQRVLPILVLQDHHGVLTLAAAEGADHVIVRLETLLHAQRVPTGGQAGDVFREHGRDVGHGIALHTS